MPVIDAPPPPMVAAEALTRHRDARLQKLLRQEADARAAARRDALLSEGREAARAALDTLIRQEQARRPAAAYLGVRGYAVGPEALAVHLDPLGADPYTLTVMAGELVLATVRAVGSTDYGVPMAVWFTVARSGQRVETVAKLATVVDRVSETLVSNETPESFAAWRAARDAAAERGRPSEGGRPGGQ